jgi:hypothetical protein
VQSNATFETWMRTEPIAGCCVHGNEPGIHKRRGISFLLYPLLTCQGKPLRGFGHACYRTCDNWELEKSRG